jgi:hypothetical protein
MQRHSPPVRHWLAISSLGSLSTVILAEVLSVQGITSFQGFSYDSRDCVENLDDLRRLVFAGLDESSIPGRASNGLRVGLQEERTNAYSTECRTQLSLLDHLSSISSAWRLGAALREHLPCKLRRTGSKRVARAVALHAPQVAGGFSYKRLTPAGNTSASRVKQSLA